MKQNLFVTAKCVLAAAIIAAFAVPASAASFYVMYDKRTGKCVMSKSAPSTSERFSMMGVYGSSFMAKRAMRGMMKCR